MGGAREVGESIENGGVEVLVPDADCVASGTAGVRSNPVDHCPQ